MSSRVCTLGGVILDVSVPGSLRSVADADGWDKAPAVRSALQPRMQQDGADDAAGFSDARVVTITGLIREATDQAAYAVLHQLAALRPQSIQEFTVVDSAIGTLSAMARVTSGVDPVWVDDAAFEYAITITAKDPLKYGPRSFDTATLSAATPGAGRVWPRVWPTDWGIPPGVTPGAVRVANAGTTPYWPSLRIDGPSPNPTVTLVETGAWVRYGGTLLAGQWLDFDLANRRVLLQGQVSVRQLVSFYGDWLAVQPGGGSVTWTDDGGDPAAKLSVWGYEGSYN